MMRWSSTASRGTHRLLEAVDELYLDAHDRRSDRDGDGGPGLISHPGWGNSGKERPAVEASQARWAGVFVRASAVELEV